MDHYYHPRAGYIKVEAIKGCEYHVVQQVLYTPSNRWLEVDEPAEPCALGLSLPQFILPPGVQSNNPVHQCLVEAITQVHRVCVHCLSEVVLWPLHRFQDLLHALLLIQVLNECGPGIRNCTFDPRIVTSDHVLSLHLFVAGEHLCFECFSHPPGNPSSVGALGVLVLLILVLVLLIQVLLVGEHVADGLVQL